jgi:uncharacterized protein (TIGR00290 family)
MSSQQKNTAIFNWSGGKDSAFALYKMIQEECFEIKYLLTTINSEHNRVSTHGVRIELLAKQAESLGLPLHKLLLPETTTMENYTHLIGEVMEGFKQQGIDHAIFGDIFLEDLKLYRENQLKKVNITAVFPLWKKKTRELLEEFIDAGFKAIIVCVNEKFLNKSFVGRIIDCVFLNDLPSNVDPCGENGEYHSFVFDGPIFKYPIHFTVGEVVYKKYQQVNDDTDYSITNQDTAFYYCDLLPD